MGAAREFALVGARGRACLYARARARCAALPVRVAADVRVPGPDISAPGAAARGPQRLPGARAPKSRVAGRRAPCCWVAAPERRRARHPCCGEGRRVAGRAACSLKKVVGWTLPAQVTSPDRRGLGLRRNQPALRAILRPRLSAKWARLLVLFRMRCPEAHVRGGCLGGCCPDSETDRCLTVRAAKPLDFLTLFRCFVLEREGKS